MSTVSSTETNDTASAPFTVNSNGVSLHDVSDSLQLHNLLLAYKPSEAQHDASLCPLCDEADDGAASHDVTDIPEGGDMSNQTHTDDEFEAIKSELEELKASQEQAAIEARIEELKSEYEASIAEIQAQLDTAQAAVEAKTTEYDELVSFLREAADREAAEAAMEARREEVAELVSAVFSDEDYITANLDRWAAMSDEALEQTLSDAKAAQKAIASDESERKPLESSAMQAGREVASEGESSVDSLRAEIFSPDIRRAIRTIGPRY